MNEAVIYVLTDPAGRVRYVGQTRIDIERRLARHWVTALAGATEHRAVWMRSVLAAGGAVGVAEVARVSPAEADVVEQAYIAKYRADGCDLTNRTDGGRGKRGWNVSPDTRERMRLAAQRRPPVSAATRAKMSASIRASERHRQHLERLHLRNRRPCPPETRQRISASLRGDGSASAVLTWADADSIRARYAAGERQCELIRAFGCSAVTIHNVVHGRSWRRA